MAANGTKNLPDVELCHTLSTIQRESFHDVKLCHTLSTIKIENLRYVN